MSDLHLDVNAAVPFELPTNHPPHDLIVLAGDICEGIDRGVAWIGATALGRAPVIYVPGNHEFYGRERTAALAAGRAAGQRTLAHASATADDSRGVHVLDCERRDFGVVSILGATLWTDYRLDGHPCESMAVAARMLSDHRMIEEGGKVFSPAAACAAHDQAAAWLGREIKAASDAGQTVVVVTHHAPTPKSISERFRGHPLTAAFASNLEHLFDGVALWVHGHTHRFVDHEVATARGWTTRVVNNPRGYVRREQTGFVGDYVVTV